MFNAQQLNMLGSWLYMLPVMPNHMELHGWWVLVLDFTEFATLVSGWLHVWYSFDSCLLCVWQGQCEFGDGGKQQLQEITCKSPCLKAPLRGFEDHTPKMPDNDKTYVHWLR